MIIIKKNMRTMIKMITMKEAANRTALVTIM